MIVQCRLIREIGTRAKLRVYWGGPYWTPEGFDYMQKHTPVTACRNGDIHNATVHLVDSLDLGRWDIGGKPADYPDDRWPVRCDHCGAPVPEQGVERQVHRHRLYDTTSGRPEPGDMFWAPWYHDEDKPHFCPWDNCDDPRGHLIVILPNGHEWDVDSRASNCTMKNDRLHRCWVRHGEPPLIHVDKNGHTCNAGAGSIGVPGYHGFLHHGRLT